jgi:serine protease Do
MEEVEKKGSFKKYLKISGFVFAGIVLVLAGFWIGVKVYPATVSWLENHSFINIKKENDSTTTVIKEESTVINVVKKSKNSVVSVAVNDLSLGSDGVMNDSMKIGSGFVIDNKLVLTNNHVVSDSSKSYLVITDDSRQFDVQTIHVDPVNDIALLVLGNCHKKNSVDDKETVDCEDINLQPLEIGDSDLLAEGQSVIAIGTPLGEFAGSVTTGVISGLNRSVKNYEQVIQTDASINFGNSGGPLLNLSGQVIGINFATVAGADNISFALPINVVKERLSQYRKYGKFIKPMLGVQVAQVISDFEAYYYNVVPGALVERVIPNSGAELAGIKRGDIIMEIDGEKVFVSLAQMIQKYKVGDEIKIKIWRDGQASEVTAKLSEE